ncbi:MAG: hypothetical protein IT449_18365 [Phycisphaerales bacterium]|nr:hypothetical protein [Phycisphaerales bacterium]
MQRKLSRAKVLSAMLAVGGVALIGDGLGGCASMGFQAASGAVDFCFLFDCTDGIFGGLIDPCSPIFGRPSNLGFTPQNPEKEPGVSNTLFSDCPDDANNP